jgi:prepilin-type N-terminal cleavage/methylation domain-containing protein
MRQSERGFTLVEIMIVVAIIALLAAIAIPNVLRGRTTANESAAIGNTRAIISSLEMFRSVNNGYPADDAWITMYDTAAAAVPAACAAALQPAPDFGPPSFCLDLLGAAADTVQGFIYDYDSPAAGTYTLVVWANAMGTTGTRSFFANETGLVRHCLMTAQASRAVVGSNTIDVPPGNCP